MEQYLPNLGHTPGEGARRDAVHVAVAPVVAGEALRPGEHVWFPEGGQTAYRSREGAVGIVDPFRDEMVESGQRFWLFLYPGTVTSLRHVWQHPAFAVQVPVNKKR